MPVKITDLPAESAPTGDDLIVVRDNASGTTRRIPISTFLLAFSDLYSPTGMVSSFGGSAAPSGWLLCDGSAVDRTTYDDLYGVVGTTYGAGNGTTTFNVPDLRGRVTVGKSASGTFSTLNNSGGEEQHTPTASEMPTHTHSHNNPNHTHGVNDPGHTHGIYWDIARTYGGNQRLVVNGNAQALSFGGNPIAPAGTGVSIQWSGIGLVISDAGSGNAFNVLQPYRVLNYIIKT